MGSTVRARGIGVTMIRPGASTSRSSLRVLTASPDTTGASSLRRGPGTREWYTGRQGMAHLLLIDDDASSDAVVKALIQRGHEVRWTRTMAEGLKQFRADRADVVLVDTDLPDGAGQDVLIQVRIEDPTTMVVMTSARGTIEEAVDAMKQGASDFVRKPLDLADLELRLSRALSSRRLATELEYLKSRQAKGAAISGLVGQCPEMRKVFGTVIRL